LALDDSLHRNLEQMDLSPYELLKKLTRDRVESVESAYLQGVLQLYNNSLAVYSENNILSENSYPLIPLRSLFRSLKYATISIIRQLQTSHIHGPTLLSSLSVKNINENIFNTYDKYHHLYSSYTIATIYTKLDYQDREEEEIAENMAI